MAMRTAYHQRLSELTDQLGEICGLTGAAMTNATEALLRADAKRAEQVISGYETIAALNYRARQAAFELLALQQPVAGELRAVFSAIEITADLERMAALAVHVAKIARRRSPLTAVPDEVQGCFAEMGRVARDMADSARKVVLSGDVDQAARLRDADDEMDDLHRRLLAVLMDGEWRHGVPVAVDVALLSRFYERFADHVVEISRRVMFEVTGSLPPEQPISTS
jgi:phosphate transport system protein